MPSIKHHGAISYFEKFGQGFPILTFAPAALPVGDHRRPEWFLGSGDPAGRAASRFR